MRYNTIGVLSAQMFTEDWLGLLLKWLQGAGKTKVMSLVIAWAYFPRNSMIQPSQKLSTYCSNVIVFERIKNDFIGNTIFSNDPVLPDNGYRAKLER